MNCKHGISILLSGFTSSTQLPSLLFLRDSTSWHVHFVWYGASDISLGLAGGPQDSPIEMASDKFLDTGLALSVEVLEFVHGRELLDIQTVRSHNIWMWVQRKKWKEGGNLVYLMILIMLKLERAIKIY